MGTRTTVTVRRNDLPCSSIRYVSRINASNAERSLPKISINRFCAITRPSNKRNAAGELVTSNVTGAEVVEPTTRVVPFFDADFDFPAGTRIDQALIDSKLAVCVDAITRIFTGILSSAAQRRFVPKAHLVVASRHRLTHDKPKISFHVVVRAGIYTTCEDLKNLLTDYEQYPFLLTKRDSGLRTPLFDTCVYPEKGTRCWAVLYGKKGSLKSSDAPDERVKTPLGAYGGVGTLLDEYKIDTVIKLFCVQFVAPDYDVELTCTRPNETVKRVGTKRVRVRVTGADAAGSAAVRCRPIPDDYDFNFDSGFVDDLVDKLCAVNDGPFDTNDSWMKIMFALLNVHFHDQVAPLSHVRNLFHRFSSHHRNGAYDYDLVDREWRKYEASGFGLDISYSGVRRLQAHLAGVFAGDFWAQYRERNLRRPELYLNSAAHKVRFDEVYSAPEMRDYPLDKGLCLVVGAQGLGKSEALFRTLQRVDQSSRVLIVSHSRTLCAKALHTFRGFGFVTYSDIKTPVIEDVDRLIVCLDSIHRIASNDHTFDYVVMDEAVSILYHFSSDVMRHVSRCANVLEGILLNAQHVLMMDAHADSEIVYDTVKWLESRKDAEAYWIHNSYIRPTNRRATLYTNESQAEAQQQGLNLKDRFLTHVVSLVQQQNKRVVVPTSSKSLSEKLVAYLRIRCPSARVIVYNADADATVVSEHSQDPNRFWIHYDVVVYSPTIGAGVSFTEPHFHCLVAYFASSRQYAPVQNCFQQLFRARQLLDGDMFVYYDVSNTPTTLNINSFQLEETMRRDASALVQMIHSTSTTLVELYDTEALSFKILKNILLAKNRSLSNPVKTLRNSLEQYHIPVSVMASASASVLRGPEGPSASTVPSASVLRGPEGPKSQMIRFFKHQYGHRLDTVNALASTLTTSFKHAWIPVVFAPFWAQLVDSNPNTNTNPLVCDQFVVVGQDQDQRRFVNVAVDQEHEVQTQVLVPYTDALVLEKDIRSGIRYRLLRYGYLSFPTGNQHIDYDMSPVVPLSKELFFRYIFAATDYDKKTTDESIGVYMRNLKLHEMSLEEHQQSAADRVRRARDNGNFEVHRLVESPEDTAHVVQAKTILHTVFFPEAETGSENNDLASLMFPHVPRSHDASWRARLIAHLTTLRNADQLAFRNLLKTFGLTKTRRFNYHKIEDYSAPNSKLCLNFVNKMTGVFGVRFCVATCSNNVTRYQFDDGLVTRQLKEMLRKN